MSHSSIAFSAVVCVAISAFACTNGSGTITAPSADADGRAVTQAESGPSIATGAAQPPFNLEAILRGDGFGLVKFRQTKDAGENIIDLDVWVRDLAPQTSYSLQRAVDTALDGICSSLSWLTLGEGLTPKSIDTDDRGTGRAALWRDLSTIAPGTAFDIYFRVIHTGTSSVVLQSDCYRYVLRD